MHKRKLAPEACAELKRLKITSNHDEQNIAQPQTPIQHHHHHHHPSHNQQQQQEHLLQQMRTQLAPSPRRQLMHLQQQHANANARGRATHHQPHHTQLLHPPSQHPLHAHAGLQRVDQNVGGAQQQPYASINQLLARLHSERVRAGAREQWRDDDECDEQMSEDVCDYEL